MAGRIRTIKPELLDDERTAALSHEAWRVFVSLILLSDDYGNFRAHPRQLDGAIFWARPPSASSGDVLRELAATELITLYEVRGQRYGHLNGWAKNQRVDKPGPHRVPTIKDGVIVEKTDDSRMAPESVANGSSVPRESFANDLDHDLRSRSPISTPISTSIGTAKKKTERALPISEDWAPTEEHVASLRAKLGVDPLPALVVFRNHFLAMDPSNKNRKKLRWDLAFENWVRRDVARLPRWVAPPAPPPNFKPATPEERDVAIAKVRDVLDLKGRRLFGEAVLDTGMAIAAATKPRE